MNLENEIPYCILGSNNLQTMAGGIYKRFQTSILQKLYYYTIFNLMFNQIYFHTKLMNFKKN